MNIGFGIQLLIELSKNGIFCQYNLTYLEQGEDIKNYESKLKEILSYSNSKGISVYSTKLNMSFMNGSLFRKLNNLSVEKKHRIFDLSEAISFLEKEKNNFRVFHGTFDDTQVESSFLAEVCKNSYSVWLKKGNVWDYNEFDAPLILSKNSPDKFTINSSLNNELIQKLIDAITILQKNLPKEFVSFFIEGKITNNSHPNKENVMITDICEGFENLEGLIPNHKNIEYLFKNQRR